MSSIRSLIILILVSLLVSAGCKKEEGTDNTGSNNTGTPDKNEPTEPAEPKGPGGGPMN